MMSDRCGTPWTASAAKGNPEGLPRSYGIDTPTGAVYVRDGGILQYRLGQLLVS
jgi:hypothetical protein